MIGQQTINLINNYSNSPPLSLFDPLPWQVKPWRNTSPILLLTGSAGGGKSRLAAEKLHAFCKKYPRSMAVALRKNRSIMTNSTVMFLERAVIGDDPTVLHYPSKFRFEYSNGSVLSYAGMHDENQRRHFRSIGQDGGVDIIWLEEAIEFSEDDFDEATTRMRGKAAPWRQIILTTNPDSPTHWINSKLIQGQRANVYYSQAIDNVYNPEDYQSTLDQLTGTNRARMRDGKWVQASGLVYDEWLDGADNGNVTEEADYIEGAGEIYWAVDDGYSGERDEQIGYFKPNSHPRVFLLCQLRSDGTLCVFEESFAIKTLDRDHLAEVLSLPYPQPVLAAVDRSASTLKREIYNLGISYQNGANSVEESIKEMRRWIALDTNNRRRILVHPRCRKLRLEFVSYRVDPDSGKPIKDYDHGMDALRYLTYVLRYR